MPPPGASRSGMTDTIAAKGPEKMPPPGAMDKPAGDGKVSPEEAGVIRADQRCIDCKNYDPTSGDCGKVQGSFDPGDACMQYFDAIGDDTPPDTDDQNGALDDDEETGS